MTVGAFNSFMNFKSSLVIKWSTRRVVSVDKELAASASTTEYQVSPGY